MTAKIIAGSIVVAIAVGSLIYSRKDWPHWVDADSDCQDTRQEVLIEESLEPAELDAFGCRVVSGVWYDPYTDQTFTDPGQLDVDHFVPLKEAWRSGGFDWDRETRQLYANELSDPDHLIAVQAGANRVKSDRDPAQWLPSNENFHCEYVRRWVSIKTKWKLTYDVAEAAKLQTVIEGCDQSHE